MFNASGSKHLSYGELAKAAAKLPVPPAANVKLKDRKDFTLIGTRAKRVDSSIKVDGRALYGIDTRPPGMKVVAVAISPVLGGKAKTVDEKAALAVKGVRQVVNIDEAVAVVADHMGAAKKGLELHRRMGQERHLINGFELLRRLRKSLPSIAIAVTLVMPMAEMGQGVYTALSMLLAEELEVELDQIQVQHAPANDALYANSILHIQTTGLSSSVRAFWMPSASALRSSTLREFDDRCRTPPLGSSRNQHVATDGASLTQWP